MANAKVSKPGTTAATTLSFDEAWLEAHPAEEPEAHPAEEPEAAPAVGAEDAPGKLVQIGLYTFNIKG